MNLTYLNTVKAYLNISTTNSDALLTRLISAMSVMALSYMQRPDLTLQTFIEYQNGTGGARMMLRNWPVQSVTSIQISQASYTSGGSMFGESGLISPPQTIPAQASWGQSGYFLDPADGEVAGRPQNIVLAGYNFPRGNANVMVTYKAGYCILNEPQTIPASASYVLNPLVPRGTFSQDNGVSYANGTAFTLTTGTPTQGQYVVSLNTQSGQATYTFAAADANAAVFLNYSFIPADLENAVVDMVGERFKYMARIGEASHGVGGQETTSFIVKALTDFDKMALENYRLCFPI